MEKSKLEMSRAKPKENPIQLCLLQGEISNGFMCLSAMRTGLIPSSLSWIFAARAGTGRGGPPVIMRDLDEVQV